MGLSWVEGTVVLRCVVCGERQPQPLIASVDVAWRATPVEVSRCPTCGALVLGASYNAQPADDESIDWYVECGAGLDAIAATIAQAHLPRGARMLDVGCGYGFGLDLARALFGWEGCGVDPSRAVLRGAPELGLDLRNIDVEALEPDGRPFDLVLASEVIEHSRDPRRFLATVRALISDDGILVLSTPDAKVVDPIQPTGRIAAALSVGKHHFVVDRDGLRRLLEQAGFFADVTVHGATLRAVASPRRRALRRRTGPPRDLAAVDLEHYCEARGREAPRGSSLAVGMAVRRLKYAIDRRDLDAAAAAVPGQRVAVLDRYDVDLDRPDTPVTDLPPAGVLIRAHFYLAMLGLMGGTDDATTAAHFRAAAGVAARIRELRGAPVGPECADLEVQSLGHHAIVLARLRPDEVSDALARLRAVTELIGDPAKEATLRAQAFTELVARGAVHVAERLEPEMSALAPLPADTDQPSDFVDRVGLSMLNALGLLALQRERVAEAAGWFSLCARLADGDRDDVRQIRTDAEGHLAVALERLRHSIPLPIAPNTAD